MTRRVGHLGGGIAEFLFFCFLPGSRDAEEKNRVRGALGRVIYIFMNIHLVCFKGVRTRL